MVRRWQDAHAAILPAALQRLRTLESLKERLLRGLSQVYAAGPVNMPFGFYVLKHDELDQLFVSAQARGRGLAATLIADAEARLAASGVHTAWPSCAIGNDRAARFYEKSGWHNVGRQVITLDTTSGPFELEVWRFEKRLIA